MSSGFRAIILLLIASAKIEAEVCSSNQESRSTFLWSITPPSNGPRSFLFGTIHVAYDRVWDSVAENVKLVLNRSDAVVFELALHDPSIVSRLVRCKQLAARETLRRTLPLGLFQRLSGYISRLRERLHVQLSSIQINENENSTRLLKNRAIRLLSLAQGWEVRKPVWLLFVLYQLGEDDETDSSDRPMLDAFLAQQAQAQGKQVLSIETPREQCNPLSGVKKNQVIFAINYTLSYLEWSEQRQERRMSSLDELVRRYRCGSFSVAQISSWRMQDEGFSLSEHLDSRARAFDHTLKSNVVDQRNVRMATRIHEFIRKHPERTFFFGVGVGHLQGEFSLIDLLKRYGYAVELVQESERINFYLLPQEIFPNFKQLWIRDNLPPRTKYEVDSKSATPTTALDFPYFQKGGKLFLLVFCVLPFIFLISRQTCRRFMKVSTHV